MDGSCVDTDGQRDPQSKSFSHWDVSAKTVTAVFTISHPDLAVLQNYETTSTADQRWLTHLSRKIQLSTATACELIDSKVVASSEAYSRSRLDWQCKEPLVDQPALKVCIDLLFDRVSSHLHFANFQLPGNERSHRWRPVITALFGLIHGFGFASVLMEVGLPDGSRPIALLGFNVGVELSQILIVGLLLTAGGVFQSLIHARDRVATDLLCTLSVYWFVQRLYF